jgi:eukaryotic-like serine/threonine-protein kinase
MEANVLVDRYSLDACIAIGGMGQVWRGRDLALRRRVAIKLMNDKFAAEPGALGRFKAEARYAGKICHQGVAKVYDFGEADRPFLVMELVEGPSLAQLLGGGSLEPGWALDLATQAAWALRAAHCAGIVHQDVKPANLMLRRDGQLKLTDFGIACGTGSAPVTFSGTISGTSAYLAPERLVGAPARPASDLYSLGVVLYECLSGRRPFSGTATEVALAHQLREPPPLPAAVPAAVTELVADLMAKDPLDRPRGAAVVASRAASLRDQFCGPGWPGLRDVSGWRAGAGPWETRPGPTLVDVSAA